jgi:hypothetical protein
MTTLAILVLLAALPVDAAPPQRRMSRTTLENKIRGGWAGQMIGVAFGAPTEFKSNGKILEGDLRWTPEMIGNAIHQDDLYVEMTFAEVMDEIGLDATTEQYGEMFRDSKYSLWHANAGARRNLNRGIKAPMSGDPDFNVHANDIDFQIESDFIGLMCPGLPQASNHYADRVGRVMSYGDGLYGGMFFGAMYAAAFLETDPQRVVEQGLLSIPAASGYARLVRDVLAWHAQDPTDWRKAWQRIEEKWDRHDLCPDGALAPFNIDARINGAYVVLGLLYGDGEFGKTLEISTRAGQDSDCNPSSAAGILGVMLGYERIPAGWKAGIPGLADTKFEFTSYSFDEIVASTLTRAEKVIAAAGGSVAPDHVLIPVQSPLAPPLEQWDPGVPIARVEVDQPAWAWRGAPGEWREVSFSFEGTGVVIVGTMTQEGGRADVYLDGARAGEIDAWIPERTHDNDYWHVTGLANARHSVRVVRRADTDSRSKGRRLQIERAIVYGPRPALATP